MKRVIFSLSLLLLFCLVNESLLMAQSRAVRQRGLSLGNVLLGLGSSRQPRLGGSAVGILLGSRFPGLDGPNCTPRRDQIPSRREQIPSRRDQGSIIEPPVDSPRMSSRVEAPVAPPRMVSRIQVEESSPVGPPTVASNATR